MACQTSLTALVWWWCVCSPPSWEKECGDMKRHNYSLLQVELCWETQSLLQRRSSNVAQWDSQRSGNLRNHPLLKAKISVFFTFLCAGPILWMMVRGRKEGLIGLFSLRKYLDSYSITFNQHNYSNNVTEEMYWTPGPTQICYALCIMKTTNIFEEVKTFTRFLSWQHLFSIH